MAKAAGSRPIPVRGQTADDVILNLSDCNTPIKWKLGRCIVVQNLGANVLIGEPGKIDNYIRELKTLDINGETTLVKYSDGPNKTSTLIRATTSQTLYAGDSLQLEIPTDLKSDEYLNIYPHTGNTWLSPTVHTSGNNLTLNNSSQLPVFIRKGDNIAQLRTMSCEVPVTHKVYDKTRNDFSDLTLPPNLNLEESYTHEIKIDPAITRMERSVQRYLLRVQRRLQSQPRQI